MWLDNGMTNTATTTETPAEDAMDDIIDAWHAAGRTNALEAFPGYLEARDAYMMERWGHPY